MGRNDTDHPPANEGGSGECGMDRGAVRIGKNRWADVCAAGDDATGALLSVDKVDLRFDLLKPGGGFFEAPDVFEGLAFADEGGFVAVHEDFGGEGAGVVVGAHDGAVGAGAEEGDVIAGSDFGQGAVFAEEIAGFADGSDDVGGDGSG